MCNRKMERYRYSHSYHPFRYTLEDFDFDLEAAKTEDEDGIEMSEIKTTKNPAKKNLKKDSIAKASVDIE